jgi:hypothetical protein
VIDVTLGKVGKTTIADFFRQQRNFRFFAHHVGVRHAVVGVLENKLETDFHRDDLATHSVDYPGRLLVLFGVGLGSEPPLTAMYPPGGTNGIWRIRHGPFGPADG